MGSAVVSVGTSSQEGMMKPKFLRLVLALCALLTATFVAGCSGDGQVTEHPTPTVSGREASEQSWTTVSNGQPTEIFAAINSGELHTCGLREDGSTVCWGGDEYGQSSPPEGETFAVITGGRNHTCGLREDGSGGVLG